MTREEWKMVFSRASINISQEIIDCYKCPSASLQEKLIAQEIINQIFRAL